MRDDFGWRLVTLIGGCVLCAAFLVAGWAAPALAAPDAEPWESVNTQKDHKKAARFNRETYFEAESRFSFVDAGVVWTGEMHSTTVQGDTSLRSLGTLTVASDAGIGGNATVSGSLTVTGKAAITANGASCGLDGGSPAQCDVTVTAGAKCVCSPVGTTKAIALAGCAVSLSSTTLTITGTDSATTTVNAICDR